MDQVSRPLLIVLGATVVLALAWFTVLRPGEDVGAEADLGPVAPVVGAVDDAEQAAGASEAANAARSGEPSAPAGAADPPAGAAAPNPSAGAPAPTPGAVAGEGSRRVLAQLERGRVVVLLFWNGRSSDDRAVRRAVADVDRRGGDVRVIVERLDELADYAAVTEGVRVEVTPTTLVIAPDRTVQAIPGYTVTDEIEQAVRDALASQEER